MLKHKKEKNKVGSGRLTSYKPTFLDEYFLPKERPIQFRNAAPIII